MDSRGGRTTSPTTQPKSKFPFPMTSPFQCHRTSSKIRVLVRRAIQNKWHQLRQQRRKCPRRTSKISSGRNSRISRSLFNKYLLPSICNMTAPVSPSVLSASPTSQKSNPRTRFILITGTLRNSYSSCWTNNMEKQNKNNKANQNLRKSKVKTTLSPKSKARLTPGNQTHINNWIKTNKTKSRGKRDKCSRCRCDRREWLLTTGER